MRTKNFPEKQNIRREAVINRLEEQLERGTKMVKHEEVSLSLKDIERIKKELKTLNSKLSGNAREKKSKRKRT